LLFAARGLQGVFAALLAPAALSLITVTFHEPKERARAFSIYGAISGGGAEAAPATRNLKDFRQTDVHLIDPWQRP